MNKSMSIILTLVIVGAVSVYAISPYFLQSTIDEAIPTDVVIQPKKESMPNKIMLDDISPISYVGTFIGVGDGIHNAQGTAYTITTEDGSELLRLENFESTNGPDLHVYLSTEDNASDFVDLGNLKANKGNQNYDIPVGTDLQKYNKVLIWCKTFSVLFGSAELDSS